MKQSVNLLLSIILLVGAVTIAASSEPKSSTSSSSLLRKGIPDEDGAAKQPKRNLQLFGDGGGILDAIFGGGDDDDDDEEVPSDNGGTNSTDDGDEEDGGLLGDGDFNLTESIEGIVDAVQNVTDGIIDDDDDDDEDSEGLLDGLLDWNSTDEGDGLFDGGLLDGDFNLTDIISNISDAFKNFTDGDGSGIFGDWNLTGDGDGIFGGDFNFTEIIQNITDGFNLTDGIFGDGDGLFNFTDGIVGGGGLFNFTDGIFGELFNRTGGADALLTPGLIDTWIEDAVVDEDQVCTSTSNDTDVPACLSPMGAEGFWVCRTLTNPFTGEPSSQTVCIGEGRFLSNNDECGCCEPDGCPAVCDCTCDNDGEGDGVLIQTSSPLFGNMTVCVDPRYAVSAIAHSNNDVSCDTSCSSD